MCHSLGAICEFYCCYCCCIVLFSSDGVTSNLELMDLSRLASHQDTGRAVCLYLSGVSIASTVS